MQHECSISQENNSAGRSNASAAGPRKANDCVTETASFWAPVPLVDSFWTEGELALLFGPSGAGKSLFAVQAADALARGKPLGGFQMPGRRKVLYVDLALSDRQFRARYCYIPEGEVLPKSYRFAEKLYRDRPPADADLRDWLSNTIRENGFQAVIIDDLSAVKETYDGTRETLALLRRLRALCEELDVSILVIASCEHTGRRTVCENDLKRSRVLCSVADSVFAIGTARSGASYIVQTRSRNAPIVWTEHNAPTARIKRLASGLLGFEFDDRFAEDIDDETCELIRRVKAMRENGITFRVIAQRLGISKTRAANLLKKWRPDMGTAEMPEEEAAGESAEVCDESIEEWQEAGFDRPEWLEDDGETIEAVPEDVPPEPAGPKRLTVYDLKHGTDSNGDEIYIESEDENARPRTWYKLDTQGNRFRVFRDSYGHYYQHVGTGPFL